MPLVTQVDELRRDVRNLRAEVEANAKTIAKQEEQLNGERGMSAAINQQTIEIRSLRKAAYWVGGLIVTGSITMAFSALSLVGGH